jgi:ubiquinone/menaquinone biosynthesis C-methylase UbiE
MDKKTDKHEIVINAYAEVAKQKSSCRGPGLSCCGAPAPGTVPEAEMGLSCGNPVAFSELRPGDVVVDLGSGGGRDVFPAAEIVGASGKVIGVDMTREMIDLADKNAQTYRKKTGLDNVEFRFGKIEELPVEDGSVDVVISNCVINLSPDKPQVFGEIFRVLKPGGKMVVSDMVLYKELPDWAKKDDNLYTSCVAGALMKNDYVAAIIGAGFGNVDILSEQSYSASKITGNTVTEEHPELAEELAASITLKSIKKPDSPCCCS